MKTDDLIEEIRSFPLEERAHLADVILKSLNQPASDTDLKWGELAVQRLFDLKTGLAQAIPRYDVFEEIWTRSLMRYSFHTEAKIELSFAVDYYENRKLLLGRQFATEVSLTIQRIVAYPTMWPFIGPGVRRCLLRRFPFGIIYHIDE